MADFLNALVYSGVPWGLVSVFFALWSASYWLSDR
jgi:hypothetical protein